MIAANQPTPRRMPPPVCPLTMISRAEAVNHRRLERELLAATAGTLALLYQPRFCLATGEVVANEAFVRWPQRKQGMVPPGALIPITKQNDSINLINAWMLAEACREAAC